MTPQVHFTLGPACYPEQVLQATIAAGANVCRINLSHTQPEQLAEWFAHLRRAAAAVDRRLRIGADIRGRKIRIGPLPGGELQLEPEDLLQLVPVVADTEQVYEEPSRCSVNCPTLGRCAQVGDLILLHDGAIRLRVDSVSDELLSCRVEIGGPLPERSGFALPGRRLMMPSLTGKDEADLDALAPLKPDLVYLSYVETGDDITMLREALARRGLEIPVIAKIERSIAFGYLDQIAATADVLCLARGDLGVEEDLPQLPHLQRQFASAAISAKKPRLLAGETMLTLVSRQIPSRAELTDYVVALDQGFDGFVLSDETAIGCAPAEAVAWVHRIADAQTVTI